MSTPLYPPSDFAPAKKRLGHLERGYANDPVDRGGETLFGVSRVKWPSWPGWVLVDSFKEQPGFPQNAEKDPALNGMAARFYQSIFWDAVGGSHLSQRVAEELLDQGVHMGQQQAIKHLQESLNLLNDNEKRWSDLAVDGDWGPKTLAAFQACMLRGWEDDLLGWLDVHQGDYLADFIKRNPMQEKYSRGFIRRVFAKRSGEA